MTKGTLFLVDWDGSGAEARADSLRDRGFWVDVESGNGGRAFRRIRTSVPEAIVLDLRKKPAQGRDLASALRGLRTLRDVPIVCIEPEDTRALTRVKLVDAIFATPETLVDVVASVVEERSSRTAAE